MLRRIGMFATVVAVTGLAFGQAAEAYTGPAPDPTSELTLLWEDFESYQLYNGSENAPGSATLASQSFWRPHQQFQEGAVYENPDPASGPGTQALSGRQFEGMRSVWVNVSVDGRHGEGEGLDWALAGNETIVIDFFTYTPHWWDAGAVKLIFPGHPSQIEFKAQSFSGDWDAPPFTVRDGDLDHYRSVDHTHALNQWVQRRAVVDFTGHGGEGSASLFYRTDDTGQFGEDVEWIAVDDLQDHNLNISSISSFGGDYEEAWASMIDFRLRNDGTDSRYYNNIHVWLLEDDDVLVGDMNFDGVVDTGDVAAFVLALTNPSAYQDQYEVDEATMIAAGDVNSDGVFDTGDVAPFVQLLVSGNTANVPEPGSLALLGLGGLILLRRRRAA